MQTHTQNDTHAIEKNKTNKYNREHTQTRNAKLKGSTHDKMQVLSQNILEQTNCPTGIDKQTLKYQKGFLILADSNDTLHTIHYIHITSYMFTVDVTPPRQKLIRQRRDATNIERAIIHSRPYCAAATSRSASNMRRINPSHRIIPSRPNRWGTPAACVTLYCLRWQGAYVPAKTLHFRHHLRCHCWQQCKADRLVQQRRRCCHRRCHRSRRRSGTAWRAACWRWTTSSTVPAPCPSRNHSSSA